MLFAHFLAEEITVEHAYLAYSTTATPTPCLHRFNALAFQTMKQGLLLVTVKLTVSVAETDGVRCPIHALYSLKQCTALYLIRTISRGDKLFHVNIFLEQSSLHQRVDSRINH